MKTECECCGTCCRNGGPPLHLQDAELVKSGRLKFEDLVTIRCGELVLPPLASQPVSARSEWIKIKGVGREWCCRFLDAAANTCTIYQNRPVSCRTLKCWDTNEILAMAGRELLSRADLVAATDPLLPLLHLHDKQCPVPDMEDIVASLNDEKDRDQLLSELRGTVESDLRIRSQAVREHNISLELELFYFGRPLFQLLQPLGIAVTETPRGIALSFRQT